MKGKALLLTPVAAFAAAFLLTVAVAPPASEAQGPPPCDCLIYSGSEGHYGRWDSESLECQPVPCQTSVE